MARDKLMDSIDRLGRVHDAKDARIKALELDELYETENARVWELRKALDTYGRHSLDCEFFSTVSEVDAGACSCGLSAALDGTAKGANATNA